MEQRLSLVTLGVADVARARRFYETLGWRAARASVAECAFFQLNGMGLALYGRDDLARDAGLAPEGEGFRSVMLAQNVASPDAVGALFEAMVAAGARALKPPHRAHWGGTIAFAADPDGHVWEIAHNPFFALDESGNLTIDAGAP